MVFFGSKYCKQLPHGIAHFILEHFRILSWKNTNATVRVTLTNE